MLAKLVFSRHTPNWTALLLSLLFFLAPASGVPSDELLQDTWKSALVAIFVFASAISLLLEKYRRKEQFFVPFVFWIFAALGVYALASMVWSHAYLGGVEAIRWFVLALLLWVGANNLTQQRVRRLAWGIHAGAATASLWCVLQFVTNFSLFPQGPMPASTFVNRNMFAEYLVCTLPISLFLISSSRNWPLRSLLAFSLGIQIAALFMTGTRSALLALGAIVLSSILCAAVFRAYFLSLAWSMKGLIFCLLVLATATAGIGILKTSNPVLISEYGAVSAIDRAFSRAASLTKGDEYTQGSFSVRWTLWETTGRMIAANPFGGVGAGAWEVAAPLHQGRGSQVETDYYAHNEFLQLIAEYGMIGWLVLLAMLAYVSKAAKLTWQHRKSPMQSEFALRSWLLFSLLSLLIVSAAGFPWRMACTAALLSIVLGALAASDRRLGKRAGPAPNIYIPTRSVFLASIYGLSAGFFLSIFVSWRAAEAEYRLVRGVRLATHIANSGNPNDFLWQADKKEIARLMREGIAINAHYRKITPLAADAMAKWGDWPQAISIWQSVLESRPNVVVLLANITRGYIRTNQLAQAQVYLDRATRLQPDATALLGLQVLIWARTDKINEAIGEAHRLMNRGQVTLELTQAAYLLGTQHNDTELAQRALMMQTALWPDRSVGAWLRLGKLYAAANVNDHEKALEAFQTAYSKVPPVDKAALLSEIPVVFRGLIKLTE